MEITSGLSVILYVVLIILGFLGCVFIYKMILTIDKTNTLLDDIYSKVKKLDNLFEVIDRGADTLNMVTDKVSGIISSSILKIFKKRRKDDDYE